MPTILGHIMRLAEIVGSESKYPEEVGMDTDLGRLFLPEDSAWLMMEIEDAIGMDDAFDDFDFVSMDLSISNMVQHIHGKGRSLSEFLPIKICPLASSS